jgi:hypothetical protein
MTVEANHTIVIMPQAEYKRTSFFRETNNEAGIQ